MAYLDSDNVDDLVADIKALADQTYAKQSDIPAAGTTTPKANSGNGSAGSSNKYAREDHVHPAVKVPTLYLKNIGATTITDATFGFIDTGLSAGTYALLAAYAWMNSNVSVRISNLYSGGSGSSNYRVQLVNASGQLITSGTYYIYLVYVLRSDLTNAT